MRFTVHVKANQAKKKTFDFLTKESAESRNEGGMKNFARLPLINFG